MAYKKFDELKIQTAERKWLEKSPARMVSGEFYQSIPAHVYAPLGGFRELHKRYKESTQDRE